MSQIKTLDILDLEFQYYCSLVKEFFSLISDRCAQLKARAWLHKLSDPIYNASTLREKRNHYLLMLTICLSISSLIHPFDKNPPHEVFEDNSLIQIPNHNCNIDLCQKTNAEYMCDIHDNDCPKDIENIGKILDEQFQFIINIAEPLISKLSQLIDRHRGKMWIEYLRSKKSNCFHMKGVRNDYAILLSGYAIYDELPGPFTQLPIEKLIPLKNFMKLLDTNNFMETDPSHPKTIQFLKDIPHPEEGAFAFITISGNNL